MIMLCTALSCYMKGIIYRKIKQKRYLILALLLSFFIVDNIYALEYIEHSGIIFYYELGEEEIIASMTEQTPDILSFLKDKGLEVKRRIHVVLDNNLDADEVVVHMIPHSEIRVPVRAPGVLEEGYTQEDPWTYFLFKGLCLHGLYAMRFKIPSLAHKAFGEIVSPNIINPQWLSDGTFALLYSLYTGSPIDDPLSETVFSAYVPEDIAQISNHPGNWPGHYAYRIYGRPFIYWLYMQYGWEGIHEFLKIHGGGIIPVEIDLKAKKAFGKTWANLWDEFRSSLPRMSNHHKGLLISGYNPDPFIYWNVSGIYPGMKRVRRRSRYGYAYTDRNLWVSEIDDSGVSRISRYSKRIWVDLDIPHIWDPGEGGIAVTRKGSKPYLVFLDIKGTFWKSKGAVRKMIPSPPGALQLSGPVLNSKGQIAVSAHVNGNWDIWVYDTSWQRVTRAQSVEMDPYWDDASLVFSSNISGIFQIHRSDMSQLTRCRYAAVLPRNGSFLCLKSEGWAVEHYEKKDLPVSFFEQDSPTLPQEQQFKREAKPYSPLKSMWPNFIAPDLYAGISDVQLGLVTWSRDVTSNYSANAGFRYSFELDYVSWRAGAGIKDTAIGFSRYPVSYDPVNTPQTQESRNELRLSLRPHQLRWIEFSLHRLSFEPLENHGQEDTEFWGSAAVRKRFRYASTGVTLETYSGGRKSLFGNLRFLFGSEIYSSILIQAGKTWGDYTPGHGSFRVGGDVGEGYFTQRPSRLFALRGFSPNVLEADKALTSGLEVYWPVANIQMGYKTMPLFLHRLYLGTFIDAGICSERITWDQKLIGAGMELITSMEVAWGNLSSFRMGIAWPVDQPDYLDEKGPVFIVQIGRPL
jgi:hypothetical protein